MPTPATICRIFVFPEQPCFEGTWRVRFDRIESQRQSKAVLHRYELTLPQHLVSLGVKEMAEHLRPFNSTAVNLNGSPVTNAKELHERCHWFMDALGARTRESWRTAAEVND
ncbi:MAG TPA: hypothetical protein VKG92_05465 [Flavobacteriales bacterium]|nr:hypothetical protein [Flavobacteriales bacterium]